MAKQTAFLQRRGDTFSFRIAIPTDLRAHFGHREFVRAVRTTDKHHAVPLALSLASRAKRLFHDMRSAMSNGDHEKLMRLVQWVKLASATTADELIAVILGRRNPRISHKSWSPNSGQGIRNRHSFTLQ